MEYIVRFATNTRNANGKLIARRNTGMMIAASMDMARTIAETMDGATHVGKDGSNHTTVAIPCARFRAGYQSVTVPLCDLDHTLETIRDAALQYEDDKRDAAPQYKHKAA